MHPQAAVKDVAFELYTTVPGSAPRIRDVGLAFQTSHDPRLTFPIPLLPKTDVDYRAVSAQADSAVSGNFDILLINQS